MAGPFARWDVTEEESSACRDSDHEVEILWAGDILGWEILLGRGGAR